MKIFNSVNLNGALQAFLLASLSACGGGGGGSDPAPPPPPVTDAKPSVGIQSPTNQATVSGMETIVATASDDKGISKVEFFIGGTLIGTDTTSPYEASWDTTAGADGAYTIMVKATDTAATPQTAEAQITVTSDNAPVCRDVSGTGGCDNQDPKVTLAEIEGSIYSVLQSQVFGAMPTICAYAASSSPFTVEGSYRSDKIGSVSPINKFAMTNDGTGRDRYCGTPTLTIPNPTVLRINGDRDFIDFSINVLDGNDNYISPGNLANVITQEYTFHLQVVSQAALVQTNLISQTKKGAPYALNFWDDNLGSCDDLADLQRITNQAYNLVAESDPWDAIVILKAGKSEGRAVPQAIRVSNNFEHNALGIFDNAAQYGSSGRLRGILCQSNNLQGVAQGHELPHLFVGYYSVVDAGSHYFTMEEKDPLGAYGCLARSGTLWERQKCDNSNHRNHHQWNMLTLRSMELVCESEYVASRFAGRALANGEQIAEGETILPTNAYLDANVGQNNSVCTTDPKAFRILHILVTEGGVADDVLLSTINSLGEYTGGNFPGSLIQTNGFFDFPDPGSFEWKAGTKSNGNPRATFDTTVPPLN